jgi:hypothetical protein
MKRIHKKNIKWWITVVACTGLFAIIAVFSYMKMDFLWTGVRIEASINKESSSPVVSVHGNAKNATYITLNGREIFIDKDGTFTEPVALLPGLSVLTLNAEDKFGKTSEKKMEIMYQKDTGTFAVVDKNITTN